MYSCWQWWCWLFITINQLSIHIDLHFVYVDICRPFEKTNELNIRNFVINFITHTKKCVLKLTTLRKVPQVTRETHRKAHIRLTSGCLPPLLRPQFYRDFVSASDVHRPTHSRRQFSMTIPQNAPVPSKRWKETGNSQAFMWRQSSDRNISNSGHFLLISVRVVLRDVQSSIFII